MPTPTAENLKRAKNIVKKIRGVAGKTAPKLLGAGANGQVWNLGNRVMKIIERYNRSKSQREINLQKNAARWGLSPAIRSNLYNVGNSKGAFLMNKLPRHTITAANYNNKYENYPNYNNEGSGGKRNNMLKRMIETLHGKARITHGNSHRGNIMFTINPKTGKIERMWFIDFGRSAKIPVRQSELNVFKRARKVNPNNYPNFSKSLYEIHRNASGAVMPNTTRHNYLKINTNKLRPQGERKRRRGALNSMNNY